MVPKNSYKHFAWCLATGCLLGVERIVSTPELRDVIMTAYKLSRSQAYRMIRKAKEEGLLVEDGGFLRLYSHGTFIPGTNIRINFQILEGSFESSWHSGILKTEWSQGKKTEFTLPYQLQNKRDELIKIKESEARATGAPFFNGTLPRLDRYSKLDRYRVQYNENKSLKEIILYCSVTKYFDFMASNYNLDVTIGSNQTVRTMFAKDPFDLDTSGLANPISINMVIDCEEDKKKVVFAHRLIGLMEYPNTLHALVAGSVNLERKPEPDINAKGVPDLFLASMHEAREEAGLDEKDISDVLFMGFGRDLTTFKPEFLGIISVPLSAKQLEQNISHKAKTRENRRMMYFDLNKESDQKDLVGKILVQPYPLVPEMRTTKNLTWVPSGQVLALWSLIRALGYDETVSLMKKAIRARELRARRARVVGSAMLTTENCLSV